jgi:hypothetical protein
MFSMIDPSCMRLSVQKALLGHITKDLRAVCVKNERGMVVTTFFCDGKLSEELEDCALITDAEISSSLPWKIEDIAKPQTDVTFVCVEYPQKMPLFEYIVYHRYEKGDNQYRAIKKKESFCEINLPNLVFSSQQALLGRITSNLRRIAICNHNKKVSFYFYYDGEISDLEKNLAHDAIREICSNFSLDNQPGFDLMLVRTDFPEKIFLPEQSCWFYVRYEK